MGLLYIDDIESAFQEKAAALGLDPKNGEIAKYQTEDGTWIFIVTRQGYRRVLSEQPDYGRHVVYPIYSNTQITIDGDNITVQINGIMGNLMGAMGFLYKQGTDGFWTYQVAVSDYDHLYDSSPFWKTSPHAAAMKTCEIALIRMAYPVLFSNVYSDDEIAKVTTKTMRQNKINYIRQNIEKARAYMTQDVELESLEPDEIDVILERMKNGSTA